MTTARAAVPFGTAFARSMPVSRAVDGVFEAPRVQPLEDLALHPAAHVLHYGSACFEGLKAHRGVDGAVRLFRPDRHVARMRHSAERLLLPVPDEDMLLGMVRAAVDANRDDVPQAPGALYVRPVLIGTEPNIGAAAAPSREALLYVLCSPVGDYFAGGSRPLSLLLETEMQRTTPHFGQVKCGANYVMALGPTRRAAAEHGVDQVLFAPGGHVQETGAANFLLLDRERVTTSALDGSFLHGVTRDSVLQLARASGYEVEERPISSEELLERAPRTEAALSGTAAVLSGVGALVHRGTSVQIGDGEVGATTQRLRQALVDVQRGVSEDRWGWTVEV